MSFRKRNVGLSSPSSQSQAPVSGTQSSLIPGVRPSPLDGRPTTSTGTSSLDDLLGHSGFALGNSLLVQENGTTEFGATLLRYFAAEGVVQGHSVHIVGVGEPWGRELPAVVKTAGAESTKPEAQTAAEKDRMKIAWRYERLGDFGTGPSSARAPPAVNRTPTSAISSGTESTAPTAFCHTFDLTKRLALPDGNRLNYIPVRPVPPDVSPFQSILHDLREQLASSSSSTVHRLIIPNLLSPALYPMQASNPQHLLQFLHSLRAFLRRYSTQLAIMMTLPVMLYPRSAGLTRWIELLSDGVMEFSPFPRSTEAGPPMTASGSATAQEETPQGMVKMHRLPVFSEKGGGGTLGDDLVFTVSRRKFVIKPFNLPPVEGDAEAQRGEGEGKPTTVDIDF
ncbi:Elongator subunit elp4 [Xanthoria calcicola]